MQTDIPLKRLTALCAHDLLPLLSNGEAHVIAVETLELPASATRLDNVLRLRSSGGQEYLHVIEWQGYTDPAVLWRLLGYLAWLGQRHHQQVVIGTVIYLNPASDVGDTLRQTVDGDDLLVWQVPVVRLWEQDAEEAVQRGPLGLAVLSPLMRGATEALVKQVVSQILTDAPLTQQADLLSILGVFAEPLMPTERFVALIGKERLMSSDLITYLVDEKIATIEKEIEKKIEKEIEKKIEKEIEKKYADELQQTRITLSRAIQELVEDTVIFRFPATPAVLVRNIRSCTDAEQLAALHHAILQAPDQPTVEALLTALPTEGGRRSV
ncbi:MAG: hypothetical protein EI684_22885 [Candidatus Viridilinea halotolerans]|uniref:Rpn family recombination-promoting nuclease/putative transposase n=1 Tax=Candidatus Viridilinea halotolerans TaxID=2491704 RepID=A0A426TQI2_9CHLR|nr:MAG: hypothetical protein EI684_22885 [Candidatus Viridilinea halotolerans]